MVSCPSVLSFPYTHHDAEVDCGPLANPINGIVDTSEGTMFGSTDMYCRGGVGRTASYVHW